MRRNKPRPKQREQQTPPQQHNTAMEIAKTKSVKAWLDATRPAKPRKNRKRPPVQRIWNNIKNKFTC